MREEFEFMDEFSSPPAYKYLAVEVTKTVGADIYVKVPTHYTWKDISTNKDIKERIIFEAKILCDFDWNDVEYEIAGMRPSCEDTSADYGFIVINR